MGKTEADSLKKISTNFLKKYGYFHGSQSGTLTWTNRRSGAQDRVGIEVSTLDDNNYLRIYYTHTSHHTEEKKDLDYQIPLTTTLCGYGGKRYWFICTMTANGKYCGRRVATLYLGDVFFACRHCYNLTYTSRNASELYKGFVSIPDIEEMEAKVKRAYYRRQPTKKFTRLLKMKLRFKLSLMAMAARLERYKRSKTRYN